MVVADKATGATHKAKVTLAKDEGNRPDTTAEGLASSSRVRGEGKTITAGNASQLSDGASVSSSWTRSLPKSEACRRSASSRASWSPAASPTRWASARSSPCRACLQRHGLSVDDIDLWELNEAFAVQVIYCRDKLGIDPDKLNVNGGAIAVGHPYGMSGARLAGHALIEGSAAASSTSS